MHVYGLNLHIYTFTEASLQMRVYRCEFTGASFAGGSRMAHDELVERMSFDRRCFDCERETSRLCLEGRSIDKVAPDKADLLDELDLLDLGT